MERKMLAIAFAALMISMAAAGCLGGEQEATVDEGPEVQLEQRTGQLKDEAWVSCPAAYEDTDVEKNITMSIPDKRIVAVKFSIQIIDGHGDKEHENTNTNPDELRGDKIVGGVSEENQSGKASKPIPMGGQSAVIEFRAPDGAYIPCTWEIGLVVTIKPSDDIWPGPYMWYGYPDEGFYYTITLDYTFMAEA